MDIRGIVRELRPLKYVLAWVKVVCVRHVHSVKGKGNMRKRSHPVEGLMLRVPPQLKRQLEAEAQRCHRSLNAVAIELMELALLAGPLDEDFDDTEAQTC